MSDCMAATRSWRLRMVVIRTTSSRKDGHMKLVPVHAVGRSLSMVMGTVVVVNRRRRVVAPRNRHLWAACL